eukprot:TRINITY_DN70_c0_g1_i11.p1 TRINITY_DN70_c0_g1~~TRINITY_DN70_c0_g1_i11.p1  ORF type:complete len:362 (-),score=91.40 TRINITY_DN70_c0_g1_i11:353-1291(-)
MARTGARTLRVVAAAAAVVAALATVAAAQGGSAAPPGATLADSSRANPYRLGRKFRIVGGRRVDKLDPDAGVEFMAALYTPDNGFYCGGSLIDYNHVLTRAGCEPRVGDKVRLGTDKLFTGGIEVTVTRVTVHPDYEPVGDLNDLAVLRLNNPGEAALVAAGALPIVLDTAGNDVHGHYIHGFGAVDKASRSAGSPQLKRGYQPRVPWAKCREVLDGVFVAPGKTIPILESKQVCTNYESYRSGARLPARPGGRRCSASTSLPSMGSPSSSRCSTRWRATGSPCRRRSARRGWPNVGTLVAPYQAWIAGAKA